MSVFESTSFDHHEQVIFHEDSQTGLRAIIALHNTQLGPAMGGCRMYPYASSADALEDVLRLSRGMTYKSAVAGLPYGGGKAVIIADPRRDKTPALLRAMGRFVDSLGGRYITAEDSGMGVPDLKIMSETTPYVVGLDEGRCHGGDPSPATALGVFYGIQAALRYHYGSASVSGRKVAIQGAGAVGLHLLDLLIEAGAEVEIADLNLARLELAAAKGARIVDPKQILQAEVDVLVPCAMGGVINDKTVDTIQANIIAGSANNQLLRPEHGERLRERGILYAPDFVINAGGIIDIYHQQQGNTLAQRDQHLAGIADSLKVIFEGAEAEGISCERVAEDLARQRLNRQVFTQEQNLTSALR
ncbi:Glu/Leu/Phe/Val dehydrogenase [Spongiibacter sp. KMU-158]|uniref:Glu/Leu/Phe/Val dehydrogenase n=1 Tax=Spongiibacter pelagi TaxID=2760804 RepID=A0A927C4M9_9GAMM|nr:Glu/Leu/Phe/Val dehydrogenase [Spongiibacter pelagi]MBD2859812.1 Glu/Leu/Phe/Val dehydrogenase [Spongiibacter pelagi]